MRQELRILLVEDDPHDAELLQLELRRGGLAHEARIVSSRKDFLRALREYKPNLILADYNIPGFNGLSALKLAKEKCAGIPFIIVSGFIGEELAVELVKNGATDYILKDRLTRLVPSVNRALREMEERSERTEAERRLLESEEQYRLLFKMNPEPMWVLDVETLTFLDVNDAALRKYEYDRDDFLSLTILDIRPQEDREEARAYIEQLAKTSMRHFEAGAWRHKKKDGTIIDVEISGSFIAFGGKKAMLVLANDVTERKKAEEKIREQAALLDIASDAIIVRDMNDKVMFWSKGAESLYGWKAGETVGSNSAELLTGTNRAQYLEAQARVVVRDKWTGELEQTTKDNRKIVVLSRWTLVRDSTRAPRSILILNSDITEKKKFEMQFLRAQRMESIGTLAGGIAHDLNNVLAPILLTIQNLKRKLPDERSQRMLSTIEVSTKRGADMVQQVLTFTRGVEGEKVLIQPRHLLQEIDKIIRETFSRAIRITTRITRNLWTVSGNATQLHQVMMNLCVNARDAMTNGGTITIEAENVELDDNFARMHIDARSGPYIVISVADTGTGIKQDIIDKIFEPFFTTKEMGKGTGLGLSTVLAIVKGHGGFINVYSEVGKGTKFKVYLPAIVTNEFLPEKKHQPILPIGNGEAILVVDDEASICEITKETLETYGYLAMVANDGTEAVALFAQNKRHIKAVLTDMMMPYMDGMATIRALKRIDPNVKIIAASGLASHEKVSETAGNDVQAFLLKPYTAETLLVTLNQVLKKK